MARLRTSDGISAESERSIYFPDSIYLRLYGHGIGCQAKLTLAEALAFWTDLGYVLDEAQPGATGLRPLPEGDPSEVDAMRLQFEAENLRRRGDA